MADREATCTKQEHVGSNPTETKSLSPFDFVNFGFQCRDTMGDLTIHIDHIPSDSSVAQSVAQLTEKQLD